MRIFCTLSDKKYVYQGLTLVESLRRWAGEFVLYYLCLDDEMKEMVLRVGGKDVVAVGLSAFERLDPELGACRNRPEMCVQGLVFDSYSQFCWAMAPFWTSYLLHHVAGAETVNYVDSDLFFRQPVEPIFTALGNRSVGIFKHRHIVDNQPSGEFNVGMVCFRGNEVGRECARWWRGVMFNPKNEWAKTHGTCGDQKYLELFIPLLGSENVAILDEDIGHGAPWNFRLYQYHGDFITWQGKKQLLVFNHFSHFTADFEHDMYREAYKNEWGNCIVHPQVRRWYDEYFAEMKRVRSLVLSKATPHRKVAVLLTVYNGEKYLRQAIVSVLAQTFDDFELLIGLNGCTDGSESIAREFEGDRVRVFSFQDKGRALTLNKLLALADSDYIAIQDADDVWIPDKLYKQMLVLHDGEVTGTFIDYIDSEGRFKQPGPLHCVDDAQIKQAMRGGDNQVANSSSVVLTRVVSEAGGWDDEFAGVEDFDLWIRLAKAGCRFRNVPETLVHHRVHAASEYNAKGNSSRVQALLQKHGW